MVGTWWSPNVACTTVFLVSFVGLVHPLPLNAEQTTNPHKRYAQDCEGNMHDTQRSRNAWQGLCTYITCRVLCQQELAAHVLYTGSHAALWHASSKSAM